MSKAENNPVLHGQRGMFGGIVFRQVNGKTICSARPKKRDKPTEHQLKTKGKFLKAVEYARNQMNIPEQKALYQKAVNNKIPNAYTAALKDYLNAPVIKEVKETAYNGAADQMIYFLASDDFEVISVKVEIFDAAGMLVESGWAGQWERHFYGWEYKTTIVNSSPTSSRIVVTACDRPGNTTVKQLDLQGLLNG